ncbi:peptidase inhibitor family I36 protein [Pseudomonas sp. Pseusp3]|uniref:peptidase inhibitor family I36 protein n=1 Tax=Pseudomonas sp. Pseusp3 TaxID=3243029 RepID=UPI0039AF7C05
MIQRFQGTEFFMNRKWFVGLAALCVGIGAVYFFNLKQDRDIKYTLFNPTLSQEQKTLVQQQMDLQMARKEGGKQVSSTQIAYDEGAIVITFPVPGVTGELHTTCDYRYFCVWDAWYYSGSKVSLQVLPSGVVDLPAYMARQVSSWKYNNDRYKTVVYGVDGSNGVGKIMTSTLAEIGIGDECCPFGNREQKDGWTEIYEQAELHGQQNDSVTSIRFSPLFGAAQ